jgi:4-amino-4-deoxy-L-arabinose transferase-like glycosyltransferase
MQGVQQLGGAQNAAPDIDHAPAQHAVAHAGQPAQPVEAHMLWQIASGRTARFVFGLLLVLLAHHLFTLKLVLFFDIPLSVYLNDLLKLEFLNPENTLAGFVALGIAAVLIGSAFVSLPPYGRIDAATPAHTRPPALAFLRRHWLEIVIAVAAFAALMQGMVSTDEHIGLVLFWVAAIVIVFGLARAWDVAAGVRLRLDLDRHDYLWLFVLLAVGLFIGAYMLDQHPPNFVGDEGSFFERARGIIEGRESFSFFDVGVYSYPLPSSYFQAGFLNVFGPTMWSWRFASVVAGVLTVVPLYLFARAWFNRSVAVLAAVVLITLPYFLAYARLGYNNSQSIFPVMMCAWCLYLGVERRSVFYMALAAFAAGLGFYTYTAGRLAYVLAAAFLGLLLLGRLVALIRRNPQARREAWGRVLQLVGLGVAFGVMALVMVLPTLVYTNIASPGLQSHKLYEALFFNAHYGESYYPADELYRDYPPIDANGETLFLRGDLYAILLARGFIRSFASFHHGDLNETLFMLGPLAGSVGAVLYFIGLVVAIRRFRRPPVLLLLIWWLVTITLLSAINTFPPRHQHTVPIMPVIAIFIALGITACTAVIGGWAARLRSDAADREPVRQGAAVVAAALIVGLVAVNGLNTYFVGVRDEYPQNFEDVITFDALAFREPVQVVYLSSREDRRGWIPWAFNYMTLNASYWQIHPNDLFRYPVNAVPEATSRIYVEEPDLLTAQRFLSCVLDVRVEFAVRNNLEGRGRAFYYDYSAADVVRQPESCLDSVPR